MIPSTRKKNHPYKAAKIAIPTAPIAIGAPVTTAPAPCDDELDPEEPAALLAAVAAVVAAVAEADVGVELAPAAPAVEVTDPDCVALLSSALSLLVAALRLDFSALYSERRLLPAAPVAVAPRAEREERATEAREFMLAMAEVGLPWARAGVVEAARRRRRVVSCMVAGLGCGWGFGVVRWRDVCVCVCV